MLARLFLLCLAVLALATPTTADVVIEKVLVRRLGRDMNVRVDLYNPSSRPQKGPVRITLYVRPYPTARWEKVKVWSDVPGIAGGNRIARDFFEAGNPRMQSVARNSAFQARAVVTAPGVRQQEAIGTNRPGN